MNRLSAIALLTAVAMPAWAQIGAMGSSGAGMHFAGRPVGPGPGATIGIARTPQTHSPLGHPFQPAIFMGAPWFADYEPMVVQAQVPQVILAETQPAAAPPPEEAKPAAPLLIEWQGGRYVRFNGTETRGSEAQADYARIMPAAGPVPGPPARELPPVALVFRDGHREEVRDYAIVQDAIYARGNYWGDGYWTKTISISALDLRATMRANYERGIQFTLPAGPNEVVTRP